jgi:hypothetical protein
MTSELSCASGNPATSNPVVMTVANAPQSIILQDISVTGTQCYDAIQTITVAGNGHTFIVYEGGNAIMIAGTNILFLPGAAILSGGYLSGTIAPAGPFCQQPSMVTLVTGQIELPVQGTGSCKVYPNPTNGKFTLEFQGFREDDVNRVEIFNLQGIKIISRDIPGALTHEFSLSGNPPGIYFVRITAGSTVEVLSMIKD